MLASLAGCGGKLDVGPGDPVSSTSDASVEPSALDSATPDAPSAPIDTTIDAGTVIIGPAPPDAATQVVDAGFGDAALAAPCLVGGNVFYADGDHYPGVNGIVRIEGSQGTWSGTVASEVRLQLRVEEPDGGLWSFVAASPVAQALTPGAFVSSGDSQSFFADVGNYESAGCAKVPTGTYTIASLASIPGDEGPLTELVAWFNLTCPADGTTVVGCVSYKQ